MSEQNKAIVEQAYNHFKTGDIEALLNLMSDDITWTLPEMEGVPFAGARTGRAAVGEFFEAVNGSQEVVTFEPRELIAEGDRVVALGSTHGAFDLTARNSEATSLTHGPSVTARLSDFRNTWTLPPAPTLTEKP